MANSARASQQYRTPAATNTSRQSSRANRAKPNRRKGARTAWPLTKEKQIEFEVTGHTTLRNFLDPDAVAPVARAAARVRRSQTLQSLQHRLRVLRPHVDAAAVGSEDEAWRLLRKAPQRVGFLQFFNSHRHEAAVRSLVLSPRLGRLARQLLHCRNVRLYQDALFVKTGGMGETNWHSDLRMTPLDTNSFLTVWIPLHDLGCGDSGLEFADASHRDMSLLFWRTTDGLDLQSRGYRLTATGRMGLGDVSIHHGWCLHCAPPQQPQHDRVALAVSYFADGTRVFDWQGDRTLKEGAHHLEDKESYADWLMDLKPGGPARHELLPVVPCSEP